MIKFFKSRSFLIYAIALSTPLFSWLVLFNLAQKSTNSYDPNPWIQSFVENPGRALTKDSSEVSWIHVVSDQGKLVVQNGNKQLPLISQVVTSKNLIILVEAQGPTLARQLYDYLKDRALLKTTLVLAVSDGFLKDIRYYDGEIALGAGQAYLVRFRALQTLLLEKFLLINMSGLWLRPEIFKDSTQKLTDTFVGLHVPVFIGPIHRQDIPSLPKNANFLVVD
jgi:hypothetical protein